MSQISNGVKFQRNISLKNYTTFKIGGRAKYFFLAKNRKDLTSAIKKAKEMKLPFFILGGGSNVLISDKVFNGLVIKIQNTKYKILNTKILVWAGTPLGKLVRISVEKGLAGLEWAAGIPGTVGGAVFGNAGWSSNKKNISSIVDWTKVLETEPELKIKKYKKKDCKFGYRDSIFRHKPTLIILSVCLKLKKGKKEKIRKRILEILKSRKEKIPAGFSAGSIFKNPPGTSAGYLIEKCNLKGKKVGDVKVSEKHANFIINLGGAEAKDVKKLIKLIKEKVKNKFRVVLEEEIQFF